MWYKINFYILSLWMLPTFLRKTKTVALVKALVYPVQELHYEWESFRKSNLYKLAHNGQTCYFRKALNDALDNDLRRITIAKPNNVSRQYIYTREEKTPFYLGKLYIYPRTDYVDNAVDFTVNVPEEIIEFEKFKLEFLIEFYKPASKRYKIVGT